VSFGMVCALPDIIRFFSRSSDCEAVPGGDIYKAVEVTHGVGGKVVNSTCGSHRSRPAITNSLRGWREVDCGRTDGAPSRIRESASNVNRMDRLVRWAVP